MSEKIYSEFVYKIMNIVIKNIYTYTVIEYKKLFRKYINFNQTFLICLLLYFMLFFGFKKNIFTNTHDILCYLDYCSLVHV